jgi:protein phosphatase
MNRPGHNIRIAASTNNGLMRKNNEDAYLIGTNFTVNDKSKFPCHFHSAYGTVLAVADGMGGENAGEVASSLAMSAVREFFLNHLPPVLPLNPLSLRKMSSVVKDCILYADSRIKEHARINAETQGMGTTVVLAWILGNNLYISWCGDSRAYIFRKGKVIHMLTYDHNLLQELLEEDSVSTSEVLGHPAHNILTRYIGDTHTVPRPDFNGTFLLKGDVILLCSDGLNGMLPDSDIENIVVNNPDIVLCKDELIKAANLSGGFDNVTVVLAKRIG